MTGAAPTVGPTSAGSGGGSGDGDEAVVAELSRLEGVRCRAITELDIPTLSTLLAPTLTHTHVTGTTQSRDTYLEALAGRPRTTTHGALSVRVLGSTAVMTGPLRNTLVTPSGEERGSEIHALRVWHREVPGTWRLVAFAASGPNAAPPGPPAAAHHHAPATHHAAARGDVAGPTTRQPRAGEPMSTSTPLTPIEHMYKSTVQRVNAPAPMTELERRWRAIRAAMLEASIDALFVHNHCQGLGGMTRWFADLPAGGGYPTSLVFSLHDPMTLISHGPIDGDRRVDPDDITTPGIHRHLTTASFSSVGYCEHYDSDLAVGALKALGPQRVGFVALSQVPYPMIDGIKVGLPGVEFVDFSDAIDRLKVVKSPQEQEVIRATATFQDDVLAYGFSVVRPGLRESQVAAAMEQYSSERGSETGLYMVGAAPIGEPAMFKLRHNQERVIEDGDAVTINLENSGPGGYYTHVGRMGVIGRPSPQMRDEMDAALAGQRVTADRLRPGVEATEVFGAYEEFLRDNGLPGERRIYCHGQGYDLVERPLIRADESMTILAGMNIGVHPMWVRSGICAFVNDNFLVGDGGAERLHATPHTIVELG